MKKVHQLLPLSAFLGALLGTLSLMSACGDSAVLSQTAPGAGPSSSPSVAPNLALVVIEQGATGKGPQAYGTNPLVIQSGTTVTWRNDDSDPHTVTANDGSFDSGTLTTGQTFEHTFDQAGTYDYYCTIHGQTSMSGVVQVSAASPSPSPSTSPSASPSVSPSPSGQAPGTAGGGGSGGVVY